MILWLIVQLVFWACVCVLIAGGFAVVVLAPPFFAGRYAWRRFAR